MLNCGIYLETSTPAILDSEDKRENMVWLDVITYQLDYILGDSGVFFSSFFNLFCKLTCKIGTPPLPIRAPALSLSHFAFLDLLPFIFLVFACFSSAQGHFPLTTSRLGSPSPNMLLFL